MVESDIPLHAVRKIDEKTNKQVIKREKLSENFCASFCIPDVVLLCLPISWYSLVNFSYCMQNDVTSQCNMWARGQKNPTSYYSRVKIHQLKNYAISVFYFLLKSLLEEKTVIVKLGES